MVRGAYDVALSATGESGRVHGAFALEAFISWHDGRLSPEEQFLTIVHEDTHAKSISGSHFQTNILSQRFNRAVGNGGPVPPAQFVDFVEFHESHPMALDLLAGVTTSHYESGSIRQLAIATAALSRRIASIVRYGTDTDEVRVLRSIYLAFSDLYTDEDAGKSTLLLAMLENSVEVAESGGPNPFEAIDRSKDLSPQLSTLISAELREKHGVRIMHLGDEVRAAFVFAWMAGAYIAGDAATATRIHHDMLMPCMNYIFDGVLVPHGIVDLERRTLIVASTELLYCRIHPAESEHPFRASYLKHQSARFGSRQKFVYESFFSESAHIEPAFTDSMIYPHMARIIAQFPSTMRMLTDELFVRESEGARALAIDELHQHMNSFVPYWPELRAAYPILRREIGRSLGAAVADMDHWMSIEIVDFAQQYCERLMLDGDITSGPLSVFIGDHPLFVLQPD